MSAVSAKTRGISIPRVCTADGSNPSISNSVLSSTVNAEPRLKGGAVKIDFPCDIISDFHVLLQLQKAKYIRTTNAHSSGPFIDKGFAGHRLFDERESSSASFSLGSRYWFASPCSLFLQSEGCQ